MTWWGWLIIAAVILLLIIWGISVQRKLVGLEELCGNAMSQIGVQQNTRWDALNTLADLTKQYDEHEYKTLMDVLAQRRPITADSTAEEAQEQENMITDALHRFIAVGEAYPDLNYNDTVTKFNRTIRMFPDSLIASMLHFTTRTYLETAEDVKTMPSMRRS